MPSPAKRDGSRKGSAAKRGKKRVDFLLFALSSFVLILFSLLVGLILTVKPPVDESLFAGGSPSPGAAVGQGSGAASAPSPTPDTAAQETTAPEASAPGPESPAPTGTPSSIRGSPAPSHGRPSPKPPARTPPRGEPVKPEPKKKVMVVVIDDVGHNTYQLEPFLKVKEAITFAVLPGLPHTADCVKMLKAAGKEYILHLPMEAMDGLDPGPGALYRGMTAEQIHATLKADFAQVPGAVGINNHMGSSATKDLTLMRQVLRFAKSRRLFFLDSRTIGGTATAQAAELEKYSFWERDVFLDNTTDRESVRKMFEEGMSLAARDGRAVLIGHVWSAELAKALMDFYPELIEEGYSLTTISRLIMDKDDAGPGN